MNDKKVLIIEDDPLLLGMYKIKFQNSGYDVDVAIDGREGLDKFNSVNPDLILTDWMMPRMNGSEMLVEIRKSDIGKTVPVLVFSNSMLERDKKRAKELEVKDFLTKADSTPAMIVSKVEEILSN